MTRPPRWHLGPSFPLAALVIAVACGSSSASPGAGAIEARAGVSEAHPGYFVPPGAPDPLACATSEDCAPGPAVDPEDGCCDTGVDTGLYARTYLMWRAGWRAATCASVTCPTLMSPGLPPPCGFDARCEAGRCSGACSP